MVVIIQNTMQLILIKINKSTSPRAYHKHSYTQIHTSQNTTYKISKKYPASKIHMQLTSKHTHSPYLPYTHTHPSTPNTYVHTTSRHQHTLKNSSSSLTQKLLKFTHNILMNWWLNMSSVISALQSKKTVCALHINCILLRFPLRKWVVGQFSF